MDIVDKDSPVMHIPKKSAWKCEVFGMGGDITVYPDEGRVPNVFWRCMQYLAFGNKWIKVP